MAAFRSTGANCAISTTTWTRAPGRDGYTYPSDDADRRIDYVLRSDDIITRTAAVVATAASDRLPVYADVLLPGSKVGVGTP